MPRRSPERGSIIVWAALAIGMLFAFLAIVLNAGHVMTARGELQNAADSAATAGALQLNGDAAQLDASRASAQNYAASNPTDTYAAAASQVWFGAWTPPDRPCDTHDITPDGATQPDLFSTSGFKFCRVTDTSEAGAFRVNAVYVRTERSGAVGGTGGGALPVFLSSLIGRGSSGTLSQQASAIAVTGGPSQSSCLKIPMVIGIGCLTDGSGGQACDPTAPPDTPGPMYVLGLSATDVRTAGWSIFSTTSPSASQVCSFLENANGGCSSVNIGTKVEIDVDQGNKFNSGCHAGAFDKICDWFTPFAQSGELTEVPTISLSGDLSEECPTTYTGTAWVTGFTTVKVLAANCNTCVTAPGAPYCNATGANAITTWCSTASSKCVLTQIICNHDGGSRSTGGSWTGTSPLRPVLVK